MGTYVGEIKISGKNGFFVNFYPGYQLVGNSFEYLTRQDIVSLLPSSQYLNINLISTSSSMHLEDIFMDGDDILLDFNFDDLQPNLKLDGTRYPTAWKLDISRDFGKTIRRMEDIGYYCLAKAEDIQGDWKSESRLIVDSPDLNEGMEIMIPTENSNVFIGPLRIRYDEQADLYYVRPSMDVNQHFLRGYEYTNGINTYQVVLEQEDVTRHYVPISGEGIESYSYDLITPDQLLENFRDLLSHRLPKSQLRLDADSIAQLVRVYRSSLLSAGGISENAADTRVETLLSLFDANLRYEEALANVSSVSGQLLRNFSDAPVYRRILDALSKDPEFLDQISSFREFSRLEDKHRKEISQLELKKSELSQQVSRLQSLNAEQKIREAQEKLDRIEELRAQSEKKLEEMIEKTCLIQSLDDLKKQADFLSAENEQKRNEAALLEQRLASLQGELEKIIEQSSQKAMEMSFDHLIGQKLAQQSAKMERNRQLQHYLRAASALETLPRNTLDTAQQVSLIVHAIQQKRPGFSRNEVLNLLICLAQSSLTLFYGPSGCGKTSAVSLAAESLGLSIPSMLNESYPDFPNCSRFVKVSVEKGWSSRRDWIGYYNAMTGTIESPQPQLYDLLSILNAECQLPDCDPLPALVLLDNANLSAMEYYWSDFLGADEEQKIAVQMNLAADCSLMVPDSLHFAATVQSDAYSEPLSKRLLDRAFVISVEDVLAKGGAGELPALLSQQLISAERLAQAFFADQNSFDLPKEYESILEAVFALFSENGSPVSVRSRKAVYRYVSAGCCWFEAEAADLDRTPGIQAIDYALLQRLLPSLSGSSQTFRDFLSQLKGLCEQNHLRLTSHKLGQIIEAGDASMQYYQFFEA